MNDFWKATISGAIGGILAALILSGTGSFLSQIAKFSQRIEQIGKNEEEISNINNKLNEIKVYSETISREVEPGETYTHNVKWDGDFSKEPKAAYIANITAIDDPEIDQKKGPGGFAELVLALAKVNKNGAELWIHNPVAGRKTVHFTVHIVVVH